MQTHNKPCRLAHLHVRALHGKQPGRKRAKKSIETRNDVKDKLDKLKRDPRKASGAHPLHGRLKGKWSCWLGSDLRMIYSINNEEKQITI